MRLCGAVVLVSLVVAAPVAAEPRDHQLGLGLSVGQPTGITGEYRLSDAQSLELTLGLDTFDDGDTYIHLMWKIYLAELARSGDLSVPVYVGVGPFLFEHGPEFADDVGLGARAPFGLALEFTKAPLQVYFEIALLVALIDGDEGDLDIDGAIGFRYWF